jgi:predicted alpha/beta hydrolase
LEGHLPKTEYDTPGQRVVEGQRLMQESSDIFLGWTEGVQDDRYYYWRQLRDMKVSALVETMTPFAMTFYARMCGSTLARAHARSGDPVAIAAYLGSGDALDQAVNAFSIRYADQNSRDYEAFVQAATDGRIEAVHGT